MARKGIGRCCAHEDATRGCHTRIPHEDATRGCNTRMPHEDPTRGCNTRIQHEDATRGSHTRMPHEDPTRGYHSRIPHEDATRGSPTHRGRGVGIPSRQHGSHPDSTESDGGGSLRKKNPQPACESSDPALATRLGSRICYRAWIPHLLQGLDPIFAIGPDPAFATGPGSRFCYRAGSRFCSKGPDPAVARRVWI